MQRRSAPAPLDLGMSADNDQISLVVRRRIHPELQEAFEVWLDGIIDSAARFDGHQGTVAESIEITAEYVSAFFLAHLTDHPTAQDALASPPARAGVTVLQR